ncbi:roadblock/LC7 domain-containing protein, partial [Tenacibaculum maritimum]
TILYTILTILNKKTPLMNLEELYVNTKSRALLLINKEGLIVESYSGTDGDYTNEFSAVTKVVINMLDSFFTEVLMIDPLDEIIIKTKIHHFFIKKCDAEHVLCVISDKGVNTSLINLSLKKYLKEVK